MSLTVYVWGFRKSEAVGHTSILLSDGTYISWWPSDGASGVAKNTFFSKNKLATNGKAIRTIEEDRELEGADPVEYVLTGFDEAAIATWWEQFLQEDNQWHLTRLNCSTVVYEALCTGNIRYGDVDADRSLIWTPWLIETLVEGVQEEKSIDQLRKAIETVQATTNPLESVGISKTESFQYM